MVAVEWHQVREGGSEQQAGLHGVGASHTKRRAPLGLAVSGWARGQLGRITCRASQPHMPVHSLDATRWTSLLPTARTSHKAVRDSRKRARST